MKNDIWNSYIKKWENMASTVSVKVSGIEGLKNRYIKS